MFKKIIKKFNRYKEDISLKEMKDILKANNNTIIIDVRSIQEYKEGHIEGSINIPVYDLERYAYKALPNKENIIIVYCSAGIRSKKAVSILKKLGYKNLYNIEGGVNI